MSGWREEDTSYGNEQVDPYGATDSVAQNYTLSTDDVYAKLMEVPSEVKNFISYFHGSIIENNVEKISNFYEQGFPSMTEKYFPNKAWPEPPVIGMLVQEDHVFETLYGELYYRHIYARCSPAIQQRFSSYYNYCRMFNILLGTETPVGIDLPDQWLWDMIEEFIYQFQSFSHERCKLKKKSPAEIELLLSDLKPWNIHSVLNVLHSLVAFSKINERLQDMARGGDGSEVSGSHAQHHLYVRLGFFSLVGLLRLHCLLGDYHQALFVIENIDIRRMHEFFPVVPGCQLSAFYHVGFAYMMMRRYEDAIVTLSSILLTVHRRKQVYSKHVLFDQFSCMTEKISLLLCMCLVLCPIRIEQSLYSMLKEKYSNKLSNMRNGDISEFESVFISACPRFILPIVPSFDELCDTNMEPTADQYLVFKDELMQRLDLFKLRSYLTMYKSLSLSKLSMLMEESEEVVLRKLMCFKRKNRNYVWTGGDSRSSLSGELRSVQDTDFYIDNDMVHIADRHVASHHGDGFIRLIHLFDKLNRHQSSELRNLEAQA